MRISEGKHTRPWREEPGLGVQTKKRTHHRTAFTWDGGQGTGEGLWRHSLMTLGPRGGVVLAVQGSWERLVLCLRLMATT